MKHIKRKTSSLVLYTITFNTLGKILSGADFWKELAPYEFSTERYFISSSCFLNIVQNSELPEVDKLRISNKFFQFKDSCLESIVHGELELFIDPALEYTKYQMRGPFSKQDMTRITAAYRNARMGGSTLVLDFDS